jgi:hypothetical protein
MSGAIVRDYAGNTANMTGALTTLTGLQIVNNHLMIAPKGTDELASAYSGIVSFEGATGTLKIDSASSFSGKIGGQLAIGDVIDLANITAGANATIRYTGSNSPGTLTVSDGTHTASFALLGNYSLGNFTASSDGHGGTSVVDPPLPSSQTGGSPPEYLAQDPADWFGAVDQQMAVWAQHMASAFPSSGFGTGVTSTVGPSGWGGSQLSGLAQPLENQQHG